MKKLIYKKRIINFTLMLAMMSGFVNVSMILRYDHTVSHHTGNLSRLAMSITEGRWLTPFLMMSVCFVLGSALTGFIFEKRKIGEISRYIRVLGILILIFLQFRAIFVWSFIYMPCGRKGQNEKSIALNFSGTAPDRHKC